MNVLAPFSRALTFRSVSRSHRGCVRPHNEDRLLERPEAALWAVADGMGGHVDGAAAASRVIDALASVEHSASGYGFLSDISDSLDAVNRALRAGREQSTVAGTTLVALVIHEHHFACLWAGDSRLYRMRHNQLKLMTHDHSVVQRLVDQGVISEQEREKHPHRHVITRAVGVSEYLQLDRQFDPIEPGDLFLLCSDGLTACLGDSEIGRMLLETGLDTAADTLLAEALDRGAPDNVSFILLSVQ